MARFNKKKNRENSYDMNVNDSTNWSSYRFNALYYDTYSTFFIVYCFSSVSFLYIVFNFMFSFPKVYEIWFFITLFSPFALYPIIQGYSLKKFNKVLHIKYNHQHIKISYNNLTEQQFEWSQVRSFMIYKKKRFFEEISFKIIIKDGSQVYTKHFIVNDNGFLNTESEDNYFDISYFLLRIEHDILSENFRLIKDDISYECNVSSSSFSRGYRASKIYARE